MRSDGIEVELNCLHSTIISSHLSPTNLSSSLAHSFNSLQIPHSLLLVHFQLKTFRKHCQNELLIWRVYILTELCGFSENSSSAHQLNFRSRMTVTFEFEFYTYLEHQHASLHWHNNINKHF